MRRLFTECIRPISVAMVLCALTVFPTSVRGAELEIEDLWVDLVNNKIEFDLILKSLAGDQGDYDFFSAQLAIAKVVRGAPAAFTLDEFSTEDTAAIGPDYWLPGAATGRENAFTAAGQFTFEDFVSISQAITPAPGDVLAHYVIDFEVTSADQIGDYVISAGEPNQNRFLSDIVNVFPNIITPLVFMLVPEPTSGLLFVFAGLLAVRRRKRHQR